MNETITISKNEYLTLKEAELKLILLENADFLKEPRDV